MLDMRTDPRLESLFLRQEIEQFNAAYAAALDEQRLDDWTEMFTEDAFYVILSKENHDHNMPVGLIYCENRGMIRDRAFALKKTAMFAPRYMRHMIANLQVLSATNDEIHARANYITLRSSPVDRTTAAYAGTPIQTPILVDGELSKAHVFVLSLGGRLSF